MQIEHARRLPPSHLVDGDETLYEIGQSGAFEQLPSGLGRAVRERREPFARGREFVHAFSDVGMHVELGEAGEHVLCGLLVVVLRRLDLREQTAEHAEGDGAEVGVGTGGGEREAVA